MGLSDSRQQPPSSYLFPLTVLLPRVSQVPLPIFPRALPPPTPKSPTIAPTRCFLVGSRLHPSSADWPLLSLCNEAVSGSLALRLACSPRKASPVRLLPPTLARLLVERVIYKISSFQNIRSTRLILALRRHPREQCRRRCCKLASHRPLFEIVTPGAERDRLHGGTTLLSSLRRDRPRLPK